MSNQSYAGFERRTFTLVYATKTMSALMVVDLSEAIDQVEGGYWFDFEQIVVEKSKKKAPKGIMSEGDRAPASEKRGPCRFYMKGNCVKQTNCPYRHLTTSKQVVCKHWLNDLCKNGDDCEFLHQYDLSKMPECRFFTKHGECHNAECLYRHLDPEDKSMDCPWYARGYCKHGSKCRFKHIQKVMCDNYKLGFCPEGPNCKFQHPSWQIPGFTGEEKFPSDQPFAKNQLVCRICGENGHKARDCPQYDPSSEGRRRSMQDVLCFKCGKKGHFADKCDLPFGVGGEFVRKPHNNNQNNGYNRQY